MKVVLLMGATAFALALAACDAGPSASSKAPASGASGAASVSAGTPPTAAQRSVTAASADPRDQPPQLMADGKPMWAPNRKHTAQENADYQFGKNGGDFGAASEADYVTKVHAFVDAPPHGVQKIARSNGDALLYDAKTNTFAVVTKDGAPRTMFKPHDGASYWQKQVEDNAKAASKRGNDDSSDS